MAKKQRFFDCRERSAVRNMAKAQATVEFLMTYGWALLALIIALGALAASGVLSPSYLVSEECSFGSTMRCSSALYNEGANTKILLNITNGFPYEIRVSRLELASTDGANIFSGFAADQAMASGDSVVYAGTLTSQLPKGSVKKFSGNITYVSCAPEIGGCGTASHVITGRVTAKVLER